MKQEPLIRINEKFDKLIVTLRTAVSDDQGRLDKESTSYDNVLDAFRLALRYFRLKNEERQYKPNVIVSN